MTQATLEPTAGLTTRLYQVLELDNEIAETRAHLVTLEQKREYVVQEHLSAGVLKEDNLSLREKVSRRASLDQGLFLKLYPAKFTSLFNEIGLVKFKPSKEDAAKVLTSQEIEKICKTTESVSYSVVLDLGGAEL